LFHFFKRREVALDRIKNFLNLMRKPFLSYLGYVQKIHCFVQVASATAHSLILAMRHLEVQHDGLGGTCLAWSVRIIAAWLFFEAPGQARSLIFPVM
jgi:hypothetical protein